MATKKEKTLREYLEARLDAQSVGTLLNKLSRAGVDTPEKLVKLPVNELLAIKGIGRSSAVMLMDIACDIVGKK